MNETRIHAQKEVIMMYVRHHRSVGGEKLTKLQKLAADSSWGEKLEEFINQLVCEGKLKLQIAEGQFVLCPVN